MMLWSFTLVSTIQMVFTALKSDLTQYLIYDYPVNNLKSKLNIIYYVALKKSLIEIPNQESANAISVDSWFGIFNKYFNEFCISS